MKHLIYILSTIWVLPTLAQQVTYQTLYHVSPLQSVVVGNERTPDFDPRLQLLQSSAPLPLQSNKYKKLQLDQQRLTFTPQPQTTLGKTTAPSPVIIRGFMANLTQGTPNDNDIAMSNGGRIISVVNTNLGFYNDTGRFIFGRTLANFARSLGSLNRTYDPRVIYDPEWDRFIVVFLQGTTSADTRIITAFSKTNDPNGEWNFYTIPGNIFGDSSWSDYPIISISNSDLFITVNRLKDNTSWQAGFIESLIWQVNKEDGFSGDSLRKKAYFDIKYAGKSIWSICPVKYSYKFNSSKMYFLSVRPSDLQNDTVFLHEIGGSVIHNTPLKTTILKTDVKYGLQPNAPQPNGEYLQTNDARVLSACIHENNIHYTGNTIDPALFSPSVYYGRIDISDENNPTITGKIISYDSMDIGYPSIAYAGNGFKNDQSMMVTFSHVSKTKFAGTSVVYIDGNGNVSAPIHIKTGEGNVNVLFDTIERWGDYTGIQTRYNNPGELVLSNSYGMADGSHRTWVARVRSTDLKLSVPNSEITQQAPVMYPNPAHEYVQVEFELQSSVILTFTVSDITGKFVQPLLNDKGKPGINRFSFSTRDLPAGTYILTATGNDKTIFSKKIIVAH